MQQHFLTDVCVLVKTTDKICPVQSFLNMKIRSLHWGLVRESKNSFIATHKLRTTTTQWLQGFRIFLASGQFHKETTVFLQFWSASRSLGQIRRSIDGPYALDTNCIHSLQTCTPCLTTATMLLRTFPHSDMSDPAYYKLEVVENKSWNDDGIHAIMATWMSSDHGGSSIQSRGLGSCVWRRAG